MNILFISHYSELYGANRSLLDLIDGLSTYGVKSYVLIPCSGKIEAELEKRNVHYEILPIAAWLQRGQPKVIRSLKYILKFIKSFGLTNKHIKKWNIQLIYTNSSITPIGRILGIVNHLPHIWHIREYGETHYSMKYLIPKSLAIRLIKSSNAIIFNSHALKNYFFSNIEKGQFAIYNGIALKEDIIANYEKRLKRSPNNNYVFAIIGTISESKKQETAIRAILDLKQKGFSVKLIIAGSGNDNYYNYCFNLVRSNGISNIVEFKGFVNDPIEIYLETDCLLMCSDFEAMGRVTVEAMSCGIPVIGNNSGGTPELIIHGQTGFLYNSFTELTNYMQTLIENPELGIKLGNEAFRIAQQDFSIEEYAKQVYKVIESVS